MARVHRKRTVCVVAAGGLATVACFAADQSAARAAPVATTFEAAQRAHAQGSCGTLGAGTGLSGQKGWIVSMIPGRHELRMRGGGAALLTAARLSELEFDAGRPYYLVIEGAKPGSVLEWRIHGGPWTPVATTFLYPVRK